MARELSEFPEDELRNDLAGANMNMQVLQRLQVGGTEVMWGESIQDIIETDQAVIHLIELELDRREQEAA